MNNQRIHISIAFGDAILPVLECDDGHQRVPLKPIADAIGIDWRGQRRKLEEGSYLYQRLGLKVEGVNSLAHPMICIRLDRVEAFLNTLNPENIRGKGNVEAADWLEKKHSDWDDAIHALEATGFAGTGGFNSMLERVTKVAKAAQEIRNTQRRAALERWVDDELAASGHAVEPDPQGALSLKVAG